MVKMAMKRIAMSRRGMVRVTGESWVARNVMSIYLGK
jgi:hypothetical protein